MVINCTTVMACKSQKIVIVVAAAEKYLDVQGFTAKETRCVKLKSHVLPRPSACCRINWGQSSEMG
jgi:hypothetical protein